MSDCRRRCFSITVAVLSTTLLATCGFNPTHAHDPAYLGAAFVLYEGAMSEQPAAAERPAAPVRPPRSRTPEIVEEANVLFPGIDNVVLAGRVVDADTEEPIPCRIHIENKEGIYYAPEGHKAIATPRGNNAGVEYEPDVTNRGKIWAVLEEGTFHVTLPAIDGYRVEVVKGHEYERPTLSLDLGGKSGLTPHTFALKRGINLREMNWMSADTHIHNLMPKAALIQMKAESLDYANLMFIGENHPLYRAGYVTGKPTFVEDGYIVYVSHEIRDAQQGHMTLLGITNPVQPINGYTGRELSTQNYIPHEPLNWEAYDYLHAQGGLAFHAHFLYWPGHSSAVSAGLSKLDGVEWLTPDMVERNNRTRQNIDVPGHELIGAGPMWYHMLNSGCRLPVIGGTDKMSAGRVVGGGNRTYARVDSWNHKGFMDACARGETFTSNGPLLTLSANGEAIGSKLHLQGEGPFEVTVETSCFTQKPITYFQIIQDGQVVHEQAVAKDEKTIRLTKKLTFTESGWLAVRCGTRVRDANNWENAYTAAHTSPIYVAINDRLPATRDSARYMAARVGVALDWVTNEALFSTDEYRQRAVTSFGKALDFYKAAEQRATR